MNHYRSHALHGGNVIAIHWQFRGNVPQRAMHNIVRRGGFGLRLIDLLTHLYQRCRDC